MTLDLREIENWDPTTRAEVISRIEQALSGQLRAWYCARRRTCDGLPHEGFDYPHARGSQWPPPAPWRVWNVRAGRGFGKTRLASEWIRKKSERAQYIGIVGPTAGHVRDIMVEGPGGLELAFARRGQKVVWEPTKRKITLPNGAAIHTFSAEEPVRLRGPEHEVVWLDEPAHMPLITEVWDNIEFGLRAGRHPQVICTSTPRPIPWLKKLEKEAGTVVTRGSTYENIANLAPSYVETVRRKYEGTRLGNQELHGEILEDIEGALWTLAMIEDHRVEEDGFDAWDHVVIGVDPAGTVSKRDQTGIVVVGARGEHAYVIADLSGHYTPNGWAERVWWAYDTFGADRIAAEKNYGGEMVRTTLTSARKLAKGKEYFVEAVDLVHSRRGKALRAEPVVALYEQKRVHHVGILKELEDQMTTWVPAEGESPDRVDALVHAVTGLSMVPAATSIATPSGTITSTGVQLPSGLVVPSAAFADALRIAEIMRGAPAQHVAHLLQEQR